MFITSQKKADKNWYITIIKAENIKSESNLYGLYLKNFNLLNELETSP